jgi:hypothetical protein
LLRAWQELVKTNKKGTDSPDKPILKRVVCSDTTIEKLAEILADNPRGVLLARDELAGWLASFGRYKGKGGGTDLPHWLEMHQAGSVVVDRKTGERLHYFVPRAAVSVCGGIQPGVLARTLTTEFLDAGLAARLLLAMPAKRVKHWTEAEISPEVEGAYRGLIDKLLALEFAPDIPEPTPHVLNLSPDGKAAWVAFYNDWAAEQAAAEGELAAAFGKLEAAAARLALIHHVVTHAAFESSDLCPVGAVSVEAGVKLARWFGNEARRIYRMLSEDEEERSKRRLVEYVQARGGRITVKMLQRANSSKYPTAVQAEEALEALVKAGVAEWQPRPPSAKGGRPTRDCVLLPIALTDEIDDTDETPSSPSPVESGSSDETPENCRRNPQNSNNPDGFVGFGNSRTTNLPVSTTSIGKQTTCDELPADGGVPSDTGGNFVDF